MKSTQIAWARDQLTTFGQVSRNQALNTYISRLGAIILILKKEGMKIKGEYVKTPNGKDYMYYLKPATEVWKQKQGNIL